MKSFDFANFSNAAYVESIYDQYVKDPCSVDPSWAYFFAGMQFGENREGACGGGNPLEVVMGLTNAYRTYGHLEANSDPLRPKKQAEELTLAALGLTEQDLATIYPTLDGKEAPLKTIIEKLRSTYCGSIGYEFMKLPYALFCEGKNHSISKETQLMALEDLVKATELEGFMNMKHPGVTRFSIEGCDSLIPMMHEMVVYGTELGVVEVVMGMAHRGRLNILGNIMDKPYSALFEEFEPTFRPPYKEISGDVSYHSGFIKTETVPSGKQVLLTLLDNPSHLESVNPTVAGFSRARQLKRGNSTSVLPVVIHGESALAGQGVVYETLQLMGVNGYSSGGTLHISINNQLGFTANPSESRSTYYSTDIAKAFEIPVFHVNSLDVESCLKAMRMALELRQTFGCDVFIELNGYRKHGHNEGDEPRFTQPLLYDLIDKIPPHLTSYSEKLIQEGLITTQEIAEKQATFKAVLNKAYDLVPKEPVEPKDPPVQRNHLILRTAVEEPILRSYLSKISSIPPSVTPHRKVKKVFEERGAMLDGPIDWGTAESLAYATLLADAKIPIRISGQDAIRGTFAHRHAAIVDIKTGEKYFPLSNLSPDQALFTVYNSIVSENGVLGFEYGYDIATLEGLTIWEAQYGDFSNGAQVIIDQYITSCEQKWQRFSHLVMFLPHGYDGKGPEHSNARLERILSLAGQDNIQVVNPSTSGQMFHLLRRQALQEIKKPLFVFTPKKHLRHPPALSTLNILTQGCFQEIIPDPNHEAETLILCSGKVYYDLLEKRKGNVAILRIEQLYPLVGLKELIPQYPHIKQVKWIQEEHENQGAWLYIQPLIRNLLPDNIPLKYVGRKISGSSAAGTSFLYKIELDEFLKEAF
ncbi:MAG: 2-oxoglutarate dehydrogenase E1 component [Simkaniaceae bacterium]|nr:2-oxoglutarate dehydrogenase E1 component [Simkaniaceae bacterium]